MHPGIADLRAYPFERLHRLHARCAPWAGRVPIDLSIGEPKHDTPAFILDALRAAVPSACAYPTTRGSEALRAAICDWLRWRFGLPDGCLDPGRHVLPVNGTREAIFSVAQCVVDGRNGTARVLMPNPLYQVYEGAAILAGAQPYYLSCEESNGFVPDFDAVPEPVWRNCQLLYLCSPGNPTGTVLDMETLCRLIELADRHDFMIAADECYSEIYGDEERPPPGLLQACAAIGRTDFRRCLVLHSLSKRSNVPGMRSGFVAGDAAFLEAYYLYRTYHGCSMPPFVQAASITAWGDEAHVRMNRSLYLEKFRAAIDILNPAMPVTMPQAGFYLWPCTPGDDEAFAARLYTDYGVKVLPGSYLGREQNGRNPALNRVRIALVAGLDDCIQAAHGIAATAAAMNRENV